MQYARVLNFDVEQFIACERKNHGDTRLSRGEQTCFDVNRPVVSFPFLDADPMIQE